MYEVEITRAAVRDMQSSKTPRHIVEAVIALMHDPLAYQPQRVGKRLRPPLEDFWSARRGDFRIIYVIDEDEYRVTILAVKHRADAYRPSIADR